MKAKIKLLLDDASQNKWSRFVSLSIQLLIIISLIAFSIETLPDLSESTQYWLQIIEIVCVVIFTAEYFLRICAVNGRLAFMLRKKSADRIIDYKRHK